MNTEIRARLREEIKRSGMSQAEVARQLGILPQALNRALEKRGKTAPIWQKLLDRFGLELTVRRKRVKNDGQDEEKQG